MTRFTLYHTVTDTLGRVQGEIYTLDDGLQPQVTNEPIKPIEDDKEVTVIDKIEMEIAIYRKLKRKNA
jgi:hypothetical protein